MEQKYLWELSILIELMEGKVKTKIVKIPVIEKDEYYEVLGDCSITEKAIPKTMILKTFIRASTPTIYGESEKDIPKMKKEITRELGIEIAHILKQAHDLRAKINSEKFSSANALDLKLAYIIRQSNKAKSILNSEKDLEENKNGKEN